MTGAGLLTRVAARLRQRVGPDALRTVLAAASTVGGSGPVLVLPPLRRVLVLAPHPDDESIGAGGTIARLAGAGTHVTVLLVTDGEATIGSPDGPAQTGRRRRDEMALACAQLGVPPPVPLGLPDGELATVLPTLTDALRGILLDEAPDAVIAPWPFERHEDHRVVTRALVAAAAGDLPVYGYESHTPIPAPSHVFDISATLAHKRAALRAHATAGLAFELEACLGLARWRALATDAGHGAAEAFLLASAADLGPLLDAADACWANPAGPPAGATPSPRAGRRRTHSEPPADRLPLVTPR